MGRVVISSNHPQKLNQEIQGILNAIPGACSQAFDEAGKLAGSKAADKLKKTTPRRVEKWSYKKADKVWTVYAPKPYYRLTHLLNNGHRIVVHGKHLPGRTKAYHYVEPVEEEAKQQFEEYFEQACEMKMEELVR